MALEVGSPAPAFDLPSTEGKSVSLSKLKGKKVVLYFYPKDDTPGCTREACDFRDNLARATAAGALVYGVSADSIASHQKFIQKFGLSFPLLSDEGNAVATAFGAFGEKVLYGRRFMGLIRSTFVLDEQGKVMALWRKVKVDGHVDRVLAALTGEAPPKRAKVAKAAAKPTAEKKAAPKKAAAAAKPASKKPAPKRPAAKKPAR